MTEPDDVLMPAPDDTLTPEDIAAATAELEAARIDGSSMLLHEDESGAVETMHFDDAEETFTLKRVEDVEGILDWCKGRYNEGLANRHCEFRHVARLPVSVLVLWGKLRGLTDPCWYLKREHHHLIVAAANDRDLSGFKTLPGHL